MDLKAELDQIVTQVEKGIVTYLPPAGTQPGRLHEAMLYSMQAGGKRLRPPS